MMPDFVNDFSAFSMYIYSMSTKDIVKYFFSKNILRNFVIKNNIKEYLKTKSIFIN